MIKRVPPHPAKVPYPILRPRPDQPLRFTSRSAVMFGMDTHYGNRGTFNCPGEEDCDYCRRGDPPRFQGYLLGSNGSGKGLAICHLTAAAADEVAKMKLPEVGLLGLRIVLTRKGPASNAPVVATKWGWDSEIESIPDIVLVEIIHRIYRLKWVPNEPKVSKS